MLLGGGVILLSVSVFKRNWKVRKSIGWFRVLFATILTLLISGPLVISYIWYPWAVAGLAITVPVAVLLFGSYGIVNIVQDDLDAQYVGDSGSSHSW